MTQRDNDLEHGSNAETTPDANAPAAEANSASDETPTAPTAEGDLIWETGFKPEADAVAETGVNGEADATSLNQAELTTEPELAADDTQPNPAVTAADSIPMQESPVKQATPEQTTAPTHERLVAEMAALMRQLDEAREEAEKNKDGWQRSLAEFQNYKRRVERDINEAQQNTRNDLLKALLPLFDDIDRAFHMAPEEVKQNPWMNGVLMLSRRFEKALEDQGIRVIAPTVGELFDPVRHEAIGMDADTGVESGHITQVMQKGYASGERVLRPALVKVAQ